MTTQPNILLLFTDQQRYDTIAALGNPIIKTPALDRLVREGTTFDRCYTPSPVCVSARCALMTGTPPHKTGCVDNMQMPDDRASFVEHLRDAGYQTCGIGKMHFSPDPRRQWGFESRVFSEEGGGADDFSAYLAENGYDHVEDPHGVRSEYYYLPQPSQLPAHLHHTNWLGDKSIDFLEHRDRSRPFFLFTSFIKPHPPFENPTPWNKLYRAAEMDRPFRPKGYDELLTFWNRVQNRYKYRDAGFDDNHLRTMRAAYYGCISFIDYNIGRILTALGDEIDNTLILFSSDHGELLGDYGSVGKRCMLDAAARIPMIARWPEKFAADVRCDAPVSLLDLWPTCLAAAGLDNVRIDKVSGDDGDDLATIAQGKSDRQYTVSQISRGRCGLYLITDGRWKYIYSAADDREWVFDVYTDPRETRNLAYNPVYRGEVHRLRTAIIKRFRADGYTDPIDGDDWRRYEPLDLPGDGDFGLLYQDPPGTQERVDALGAYARNVTLRSGQASSLFAYIHDAIK